MMIQQSQLLVLQHFLHKHSSSSSSSSGSRRPRRRQQEQEQARIWSAECGGHTRQDKAQSACSIDPPLHPAEAGKRPVQPAQHLHLPLPCFSFCWPSTCTRLMTPLHTAHAIVNVAALTYACGLLMVLPALCVLHVLKANAQILMMLQMGAASLRVWQSMQVCVRVGASCCGMLLERRWCHCIRA